MSSEVLMGLYRVANATIRGSVCEADISAAFVRAKVGVWLGGVEYTYRDKRVAQRVYEMLRQALRKGAFAAYGCYGVRIEVCYPSTWEDAEYIVTLYTR